MREPISALNPTAIILHIITQSGIIVFKIIMADQMRRLIQVTDNKMYICAEAIGAQIFFMPVVTITVTDNEIDFQLMNPGYYQYPENLSAREKISHIITCMTRAKTDEETDMHKFVNAFFDRTLGESTSFCIFSREGSLPDVDQNDKQIENQF